MSSPVLDRNTSGEYRRLLTRSIMTNFDKRKKKTDRMKFLWARLRIFSKVIGKFMVLKKEIRLYGSTRSCESHTLNNNESIMKKFDYKWLFNPKSNFKTAWNSVIMILLFYTATFLPYRMCFNAWQYNNLMILDIIIDIVFFFDIIITFNTAIVSVSERIIYSRKSIAKKYMKFWFLIDLLSCIPLEIMDTNTGSTSYNKFLRILRVSRLYRFVRILRLLKLLRFVRSQYVNNLLMANKSNAGFRRIAAFFFILLISVHILGCLWFYVSKTDSSNMTWASFYHIEDQPDYAQYLSSIYFVFTTLTTVGYGDNTPISNIEKIFTIILMAFGVIFYSYMIGSLSSSLKSKDYITAKVKAKLNGIKEFAKAVKISQPLLKKIVSNIKINAYKNIHDNLDIEIIIKDLPSNLREEIFDNMYNKITQGLTFFQSKPKSFINSLVPNLKLSYYVFQDILYEEEDLPEEIYLINTGSVFLNINKNVVFRVYFQGSYFGEIEILESTNRDCTATIGTRNAELYAISKIDLMGSLKEYPQVFEEFYNIARIRAIKHEESKEEALQDIIRCKNFDSISGSLSESFTSKEKSESEDKISLYNEFKFNRGDTALLISLQNDTPFKRKNRNIWSTALGKPVNLYREDRCKTTGEFNIKKNKFEKIKSMTNPEKKVVQNGPRVVRSTLLEREVSPIMKYSKDDENNHFEELGINEGASSDIKEIKGSCENVLSGIKGRNQNIEDHICKIYEMTERLANDKKKFLELLFKLRDAANEC
ncbi:hypothetical protein SteCoe_31944 [Stentor coeruleus]|uniref:Cyclic nucleotide-binding domain-containing protein n=1 Tax=Stentor coeruleus TaxID=5963 RepID=A0A1R2B057_9CILI|nr:hypothetical protein SteCoe_31944 [Stentor coeruleus]